MALGITKVTGTPLSAASVSASSTSWGTALNAIAGERFDHLVFQASITFDASATAGAVIHRRKSTDDGTTNTDVGTGILSVDLSAGNTVVVEFELVGGDYIEVGVENEDATYALTATVKYEGTKITGLA